MQALAVIVRFELQPGSMDRFLPLMTANAAASLREDGCRHFDVLHDAEGEAPVVTLYEIYQSDAAFDDHLKTPHFLQFRDATQDMVARSSIERFRLAA
jgi:(4S)-4-hydroxy-5-phosphonooxypentane-2,3-dione isomerase